MPSTVAWIDCDSEANHRAQRILTLFREKDTRDELGFGANKRCYFGLPFSRHLRYPHSAALYAFLPWIYEDLEARSIKSHRIAEQLYLDNALLSNAVDEYGIIGRDVIEGLKTLPAAIYWAGLGTRAFRKPLGTFQIAQIST